MTGRQCKSLLSVGHPESYTSQLRGITGNTSKGKGPFGSPGVHLYKPALMEVSESRNASIHVTKVRTA